jgi:hypothetical protein
MQKIQKCFLIVAMLVVGKAQAQRADLVMAYIQSYKDLAISEMQRTGVPASITLAQGIYESTAGTSELVLQSNNHFGIKCKDNWTGESVRHDDDLKNECFRKYPAAQDSYKDHSDFLRNSQRYASLFSLDPTDYSAWAYGLKKAGYATSPKYPQALIKLIEDYHLQDYTLIALGKKNDNNEIITAVAVNTPDDNSAVINAGIVTIVSDQSNYPNGLFRINGSKVIFARKGVSYLAIAKMYDVDLSKIFEYNEIPKAEMVDRDQLIFLQKKNKTGQNEFHVVKEGETLYEISQKEGIRLESLLELNGLKMGDQIATGEQVNLRRKSVTIPRLASTNSYGATTKSIN